MQINLTVINIVWYEYEFPFTEELSTARLYQIYGHHPAYGNDALLYIGRTTVGHEKRLRDRNEFIESCARPTNVRIGTLVESNKHKEDAFNIPAVEKDRMIKKAEDILIKAHTPAMNKQGGFRNFWS